MEEKIELKNSEKPQITKMIVAIVAIVVAILSIAACTVEYFSLCLALIAIVMGVVVFVKKLDGKIFAAFAILLGLIGAFLGGRTTYSVLSAVLELGPETIISDDCTGKKNCIERSPEQGKDAEKVNEASEKLNACKKEKGIDPEIDFEDLAESEQEAYRECLSSTF